MTVFPATQRQYDYIKSLLEKHDTAEMEPLVQAARDAAVRGAFTTRQASQLIDMIKAAPLKTAPLEPGIYRVNDGHLVRVYLGQHQGQMLAKEVSIYGEGDVEYRYLGLAARFVQPGQRLPLSEVGALGIASGTCLMCGRRLDDPESVDRGIGPVCASRYGG